MEDTLLWCVYLRGPDEFIPTNTYKNAVVMSDGFNSDPRLSDVRAIPCLWPFTIESHKEQLLDADANNKEERKCNG